MRKTSAIDPSGFRSSIPRSGSSLEIPDRESVRTKSAPGPPQTESANIIVRNLTPLGIRNFSSLVASLRQARTVGGN